MRRWLLIGLKAVISVGLIVFVLGRVDLGAVLARVAALPPALVVLAFLCLLVQVPMAGWRWWRLAGMLGYRLPLSRVMAFLHVGLFFNQVLPSGVGGDAFRIWLLRRRQVPLAGAVICVLLDRLMGVAALVLLVALGLPALWSLGIDPVARLSVGGLVAAGLAGYAVLLLLGHGRWAGLDGWATLRPVLAVARAARTLMTPAVGGVVAVSVGLHFLTVLAVWLLAGGLGLQTGLMSLAALVPPVFLLLALPISLAGWGVREGALVVALGFLGVAEADALALALMLGFGMLAASLPGGLVWLALGRISPEGDYSASRP